ncbi:MAG: nucleotide pyrophosphatase [Acidobacteria bacterium]|nr:MAG: nucleotide pyrophosphatase [Acidobacteriota bacterium]
MKTSKQLLRLWILALMLVYSSSVLAYVGPGAGFAIASTFFTLLVAFGLAILTLLTWPVKFLFKAVLRRKRMNKSRVKRVVIVGLDGQDPELTEEFMQKGMLPNFSKLREQGGFYRLGTTLPAESPVAWSSFQTGCNPGKHRIFDFLVPNRKSLLPELSSAAISTSPKTLKIGKYRIPVGKARFKVGRKSQPFWKVLGDYGIFSSILRVPITFPPEKFRGVLLSAMCLPDLKGSQGTFFYYTSNPEEKRNLSSGVMLPLEVQDSVARGVFSGPENQFQKDNPDMELPFEIHMFKDKPCKLIIEKDEYELSEKVYTPWIPLDFQAGLGKKVRGLCRVLLLEREPHLRIYVTPIQVDPEKPAFPIAYPAPYSIYLAKRQGPFATLGVAEDTSGLNENIIDEMAFFEQCQFIHQEREEMFFDALSKTPRGAVVCVFDITDRVQHMFLNTYELAKTGEHPEISDEIARVIPDLYQQMDDLVGRVMEKLDEDTTLMVMSDHGFKSFRREINLNTWFMENGYLTLKDSYDSTDYLQAINWSKTKAYSVGFGGIYLNVRDREKHGIVRMGEEMDLLKKEIAEKLLSLRDGEEAPIKEVYDTRQAYSGPYVKDAPDLFVGFKVGYRAAWAAVTGNIDREIIQDNLKPWAGDHNMNPPDVPGMLFCNQKLAVENPDITDLGPTVLDLFGVPIPKYCDGKSVIPSEAVVQKSSKGVSS